jgi:hypothetical protein
VNVVSFVAIRSIPFTTGGANLNVYFKIPESIGKFKSVF